MDIERHALHLIDHIYEAAVQPAHWERFVAHLSEAYGGAPVSMRLGIPGELIPIHYYSSGPREAFGESLAQAFEEGLPWKPEYMDRFTAGFGQLGDVFAGLDLTETGFYRDWMQPLGLAPIWPIGVAVLAGEVFGSVAVYRREGEDAFDADDFAFGDLLVPHLQRALRVYDELGGVQRERRALGKVMDRLPLGCMLLDANGRPLISNRSADRIVTMDDAVRVERDGLHAVTDADDAKLQDAIAEILRRTAAGESTVLALDIARGPDRRPLQLILSQVLTSVSAGRTVGASVTLLLSDPDDARVPSTDELHTLYGLTKAEAELAQLIAMGASLDEAAKRRTVTINTARSQLKSIFGKTGVSRQSELVKLVLGVAPARED